MRGRGEAKRAAGGYTSGGYTYQPDRYNDLIHNVGKWVEYWVFGVCSLLAPGGSCIVNFVLHL